MDITHVIVIIKISNIKSLNNINLLAFFHDSVPQSSVLW